MSGSADRTRITPQIDDDIPVSLLRRVKPHGRHLRVAAVVCVLLTVLILLKISPIEKPYVGLFVESDEDGVGGPSVKLVP